MWKKVLIGAVVVILCIVGAKLHAANETYNKAIQYVEDMEFEEALKLFNELEAKGFGGYRDTKSYIHLCHAGNYYLRSKYETAARELSQANIKKPSHSCSMVIDALSKCIEEGIAVGNNVTVRTDTDTNTTTNTSTNTNTGKSSSSSGKNSSSSSKSSSSSSNDPYNAKSYYDAEDFYDDHYDDFYDFEDAEDYYRAHHG